MYNLIKMDKLKSLFKKMIETELFNLELFVKNLPEVKLQELEINIENTPFNSLIWYNTKKQFIGPSHNDNKLWSLSPITNKLKPLFNINDRSESMIINIKISSNEKLLCVIYDNGLIKFFGLKDQKYINEIRPVATYYNSIEFS